MHFQTLLLAASLLASIPTSVTSFAISPRTVPGSSVVEVPVSDSLVRREEEPKPTAHPVATAGAQPADKEAKKESSIEGGMEAKMKKEGGSDEVNKEDSAIKVEVKNGGAEGETKGDGEAKKENAAEDEMKKEGSVEGGKMEGEMKNEGGVAEAKKEGGSEAKEGGMEGKAKKEGGAEGKKEDGKQESSTEGGMNEGEAKKEGGEGEMKKEGIKKEGEAKKKSGMMEGEEKKEGGGGGGTKKEGELTRIGNAPILVGAGIAHQRPQYIVIILPELLDLYALMAIYLGFQPSFGTSFFSGLTRRPSFNTYYSIRASNNQTDSQLQTLQLINQISLANSTLSKASPRQVSAFVKDIANKNDVPVSLISSLASSVLDTMASNNVTTGSVYSTFAAVSKLANQTTTPTQTKNTTATSVAATTIPPAFRIGSNAFAIAAFTSFPVLTSLLILV
ncbi:UNVERIFIED_CONTAM: hypothetical protein HDU68_007932 [Siphonaria sp. JEL0065]|nr:hypothetical protein HDU68_007932 [Siphonaria sp. JEL0065]